MDKRRKAKSSLAVIVASALLASLSIVLGKYLAIPVGEAMRFSFENLPIMMAGMAFGPFIGLLVGVVADLVGCLLVGYTVNPLVTIGAAVIGFLSGLLYNLTKKANIPHAICVLLSVLTPHLIGSVLIKTVGLAVFYSMPIWMLMLWRLLNYVIVGALECAILTYLMKNKLIIQRINAIKDLSSEKKNDENEL